MASYKSKLMSNLKKDPFEDMQCVKCGGQDFSSGDFAALPIRVVRPQMVSIPLGEMYEITGLELNKGDVLCPKCFNDICNDTKPTSCLQNSLAETGSQGSPTIKAEKYCDVKCDVCLNKYSRSMGYDCWEAWGCATNFSPRTQQFYPGFGSCYDSDIFSVLSPNKLTDNWKNIHLSKPFIVCDTCLQQGVDKQFLGHKEY